jgi:DNA-nicking Smr family endonuclease
MKKSTQQKGLFRPFEDLKMLLNKRSISLKAESSELLQNAPETERNPDDDRAMFEAAMADVKKMPHNTCADLASRKFIISPSQRSDESEVLLELEELVKSGKGFVVAHTAEYVEGTGHNVNRAIVKRLHSGEYAVQGHIDLHGQSVESARILFDQFLKQSISTHKRMILIIHGRGLSSPAGPVLKTKVIQWLTTGPWRRWVMAFASARLCDGGAGATYVLLRRQPTTKRFKRKKRL